MALNDYHFVSKWRVLGTIDEVYEIVSGTEKLNRWWPAAFRDALEIQPGDERGVGKVVRLETKGWLPYTLHWHSNVIETDRPHGFKIKVWGDFNGEGEWRFEQDGAWALLSFDWRVRVGKPLVRYLSPLLRPLFASNHRWAMAKGEESLRLELAKRHAANEAQRGALPPPPGPAEIQTLPVLIGLGVLVGGYFLWRTRRKRRAESRASRLQ